MKRTFLDVVERLADITKSASRAISLNMVFESGLASGGGNSFCQPVVQSLHRAGVLGGSRKVGELLWVLCHVVKHGGFGILVPFGVIHVGPFA